MITTNDESVKSTATSKIERICASGEAGKAAMDNLHKQANELVEQYKEAHNILHKMSKESPLDLAPNPIKPPAKSKLNKISVAKMADEIF